MAPQVPMYADGGDWLYNDTTGAIVHQTGPTKYLTLHNPANLVMHPPWHQFHTKAEAEAYKAAHPPNSKNNPIPAVTGAEAAAGNVTGALGVGTDVNGFVSALTQRATWLRVGEGLLGIVLIAIGVSAFAKSTSVGQTAVKAAKLIK
jgi:hypothetical protein